MNSIRRQMTNRYSQDNQTRFNITQASMHAQMALLCTRD